MSSRAASFWEQTMSSFWFLPALGVFTAMVLSTLLVYVDAELLPDQAQRLPFLFGGTADAARSLLSSIASALITVVTLAFSVLIIALNQASTVYTPRVLRSFMKDVGNQAMLAVYLGSFTYVILVLRQIRSTVEGDSGFIPAFSVTMAVTLTLLCVAFLVYFFHHSAKSLQASTIMHHIHSDLLRSIDNLYPKELGRPATESMERAPEPPPDAVRAAVRATRAGFLLTVDGRGVLGVASEHVLLVRVCPMIGSYVLHGDVLMEVWAREALSHDAVKRLRNAFLLSSEPSMEQDVRFGIRVLADIGVKALSPGINDPTTAEQVISHLGDVLGILAGRAFPPNTRTVEGQPTIFWFERLDFPDLVGEAFAQIRAFGGGQAHVMSHLIGVLGGIHARASTPRRAAAVAAEIRRVTSALESAPFLEEEKEALRTGP